MCSERKKLAIEQLINVFDDAMHADDVELAIKIIRVLGEKSNAHSIGCFTGVETSMNAFLS